VRLAPETRVLFDATRGRAYLARDGELEAALETEGDDRWVGALLERVEREISTAELAEGVGRPVDEVAEFVAELVDARWLEVCGREGPGGEGAP
jgi:hypothetical protein